MNTKEIIELRRNRRFVADYKEVFEIEKNLSKVLRYLHVAADKKSLGRQERDGLERAIRMLKIVRDVLDSSLKRHSSLIDNSAPEIGKGFCST